MDETVVPIQNCWRILLLQAHEAQKNPQISWLFWAPIPIGLVRRNLLYLSHWPSLLLKGCLPLSPILSIESALGALVH